MRWARTELKLRQRRGDDSGSTLIEAAFVMPIFILLVFGIFEFSGQIMVKTGTAASVKSGARMAVVAGKDPTADLQILRAMKREGVGANQDHVERIIIWRASSVNDPIPGGCLAGVSVTKIDPKWGGPGPGSCNVYNNPQEQPAGAYIRAELPLRSDTCTDPNPGGCAEDWFGCHTDGTSPGNLALDCGWPPESRRIFTKSPGFTGSCVDEPKCRPTDLVGIYMEVTHQNYTNFFGTQTTAIAKTMATIEPQGYDK